VAATVSPLGARGYAVLPAPQRVTLAPTSVTIAASATAGLFCGVQTLLQSIKPREGAVLKD
jgi:glycosyl hydrolase family 20